MRCSLCSALVVALGAYYARDYYTQAVRYLARNVDVTSVHTEQLVGHRTRKAFVDADRWNAEEDSSIARYHEAGRRFDAAQLRVARIPRAWTVLALFVVMTTLYRNYGDGAGDHERRDDRIRDHDVRGAAVDRGRRQRSDPRVDIVPAARRSRSRSVVAARPNAGPGAGREQRIRLSQRELPIPGRADVGATTTSISRSPRTNAC